MHWLITDKGDPKARAFVDGELTDGIPHYSRQTPGSPQFTRNGQNLVFVTADYLSVWATFRPTPGKAVRPDKRQAWECTMFRHEGDVLASILVREAVLLSIALWGPLPSESMITFIRPDKIKSGIPGYCYKRAGWVKCRPASDGKPCLRAPRPVDVPHWSQWKFSGDRGGKLRRGLIACSP
jgi:hypothetical protein